MTKKLGLFGLVALLINFVMFTIVGHIFGITELFSHHLDQLLWATILVTVLEVITFYVYVRNRHEPIVAMTHKVEGMLQDKEPAHILLHQNDDFYELAMVINRLQTHQQKLLREEIQQREELRLLLSYLPIGVMVIDRYRKVEIANAAMASFLQTEIKPHRHPYIQDIHQFELVSLIGQVIRSKKSRRQVMTLPGVPNDIRVEASVIYTSTSEDFFQVLVLLYDVTEIYAVEKMQMDFISNASHELKTPVTAISGFAETLLAGAKNNPETLDSFLKIIQQESQRLTELIQDVLSISRIESQTLSKQQLTLINLHQVVNEQIAVFQQMTSVKQLELINKIPTDVSQITDEKKIVEIIKNLISNAIKYNRDGGRVTLAYHQGDTSWDISVSDTGIGIAQTEQSRIFERFYRVDSSRTQQVVGGTGLGLAIVQELVRSLEGQIKLKSQRGVGSTFTVTFPIKK